MCRQSPARALDRLESARDVCMCRALGVRPHGEKGQRAAGRLADSAPPIWPWVKCPVRRLLTSGLLASSSLPLETEEGKRRGWVPYRRDFRTVAD